MESNDGLSGFTTKMKFQVMAEVLVAVAAHAVQREAISEEPKGPRNHVFGGKRLG